MPINLKTAIREALAGSSSQQPVDAARLYKLGDMPDVQAALLELYHARQAYCCLYTRRGVETSVWWLIGGVSAPHSYGRLCQAKIAVGRPA
ncbi:MAG: hypothetical protein A2Y38_12310 [Spirochaetes bacterium GWB1_59_5]|nr:MAG: hypothetical protein A2Y38_12310 [Spirochaetes bacterium GWB1_59_5]